MAHRREELYGLQGVHLDAYDAIVQPHRIFPVRAYTLRRWTPILGAAGFWLLTALQQACFRNPHGRDWCVISREELADESGIGETTVHRYLHEQRYSEKHRLTRWVTLSASSRRHWSPDARQMVQAPNRYRVLLDPPLTREDQEGLAHLFSLEGREALGRLEEMEFTEILDSLEEMANSFTPPDGWGDGWFPTPEAVARFVWGEDLDSSLVERLGDVYQLIQGPVRLFHQYFRQRWLPRLGPKLALVVVQLRSRCYWGEDEKRDQIEVPYTVLAAEAGSSASWLRHIRKKRPESSLFFEVHKQGRGRTPKFTVRLIEPLAPEDRDLHQAMLRGQGLDEGGQWTLPLGRTALVNASARENGSGGRLGTRRTALMNASEGERTALVNTSERENGSSERLRTRRTALVATSEQENGSDERLGTRRTALMNASEGGRTALVNALEPENGTDERLGTRRTALMNASEGERTALVNASERENGSGEHLQQTLIINTLQQQTRLTTTSTSDAVVALLEGFDIDPASAKGKQILELSPPPNIVRAWMLYAVSSKRHLRNPQGFVIMRLLSQETPPTRFITYAGLTEEQWIALTLASRHGRRYLPTLDTPVDLDTWREDFAGVFRSGLSSAGLLPPDDSQMPRTTPPPTESGLWTEWEKVLRDLQLQMTEATFETHLAQATAERNDGRLIVWAANDRSRAWLDCRLRAIIERTVHRLCGEELPVDFRVQEESTGSEAD